MTRSGRGWPSLRGDLERKTQGSLVAQALTHTWVAPVLYQIYAKDLPGMNSYAKTWITRLSNN